MSTNNFVLFSFGDNDFGRPLLDAVEFLVAKSDRVLTLEEWQYWTPRIAENFSMMRQAPYLDETYTSAEYRERILNYLQGMEITFHKHNPTYDADGGSVVLDLNLGKAYLI